MEQLSRPYQIVLGVLLVFALAWFTVLKPSDAPAGATAAPPPVAVPGAAGLSSAVAKADGAAAVSKASAAETDAAVAAASGAGGVTGAAPAPGASTAAKASVATPATGKPAPSADPSAPILRDVAGGKVAVLLFFTPKATEDRAVRRALAAADRHRGKVAVHAASIARVAEYTAITDTVDVLQSPTLLVIGKDNRARSLVGFTDTRAIDQLVSDVGGPAFVKRRYKGYRGRIENLCAIVGTSMIGTALNGEDAEASLTLLRDDLLQARRTVRRLDPPKRYAAFQRAFEANLELGVDVFGRLLSGLGSDSVTPAELATLQERVADSNERVASAAERAGIAKGC